MKRDGGRMADEAVRYETRTVKCVRGMEARTAVRWEQDGWEVVSQKQGRLQSELVVRRPVRKVSRRAIAIGGGVAAALVVVIVLGATGVFGADRGDDDAAADARPASPPAGPQGATSDLTSAPTPDQTKGTASELAVVTTENTPEFAALLQLTDNCDPSIDAFAERYEGRTVAFDGSILKMNNHGNYATRYDILIGAGDFIRTSDRGPSFQFEDVNATFDMHYTGDVPDTIGEGTNLGVTATVGAYNPTQCLLRLKPVETLVGSPGHTVHP